MNNHTSQFSQREKEVTDLLLQGKSNKQIALGLGISANTVEYHLKNVYKKLQVNSRTEAVLLLGKSVGGNSTSELGKSVVEMNDEVTDNGVQPISTRRRPMNKKFAIIGASLLTIALVVMFILVNKPAQSPETPPTDVVSLPDLAITSAYVSMIDEAGRCIDTYVFLVTVVNQSAVAVNDIAVTTTDHTTQVQTLEAYQSTVILFPATAPGGRYTVAVDPENSIPEANESNNSLSYVESTPTPAANCPPPQLYDPLDGGAATPTPPAALPATPTPLLFTDPSIPMSERIVYYYFVNPAENPTPEGSVLAALPLAPTYADETYTSDTAADLRTALEIVLHDGRNSWLSSNLKIIDVSFRSGHADAVIQGEYFGMGGAVLEAASMQILMTVFANASVQTAAVTLNGDTIGNIGISNSMNAKSADYIFTRSEIETFMNEHVYVSP